LKTRVDTHGRRNAR